MKEIQRIYILFIFTHQVICDNLADKIETKKGKNETLKTKYVLSNNYQKLQNYCNGTIIKKIFY